ncbi:MAG TPA: AMP-binding protein [Alphaproteobacteria bacterium]|nr:AMP-binding protein [Alphaproteobacteria bacterium]
MSALSPCTTPGEALAARASERGDQIAIILPGSGQQMTYAEWHQRANALARALVDAGVEPGVHIGLLAENRIEWPVVQMAVALAGAVLVPLNTHFRPNDLAFALEKSEVEHLFLSEAFRNSNYLDMVRQVRDRLPLLDTIIGLDGQAEDTVSYANMLEAGRKSAAALPDVDPDAVASLQFTSGTTGDPKGALLTHAGMMANAWGISGRLRVTPADRWITFIPLFHCAGCIMCILGTVQRGCTFLSMPSFDPLQMFSVMQDQKCTILSGVPTSYLAMLDHPGRSGFDLSSLRAGTCGGADTDPELLRRCAEGFPVPGLVQVYGQTESSTLISLADCEAPYRWETCGPPLPGATVRITDARTGAVLPVGETGQIETAGPMVMRGYFKNPEGTAETIGQDGWMRTGDLGNLTPDGYIVMAGGRLRDMVIRGGENIYPVEIENLMREHAAIADIAVFGVPDDYYGEAVAAAVQLAAPATADDLRAWCRERIAGYKVPDRIFSVAAFPLTASGKIRKTQLQQQASNGGLAPLD